MLKNDPKELGETGKVGDWCFFEKADGLVMYLLCPDGTERGVLLDLPIRDVPDPNMQDWQWDGNKEAPTLTPSIHIIDGWHGYLRAGKLDPAE